MASPQPPMGIDPTQNPGVSQAQGVSNTQVGMPPQAGPPPPSEGVPMDPMAEATGIPMAPPPPPPKPPSMIPTDIARLLAEALNATKMEAAQGLTEYLGDPRGNVNVKDADLVRVWRKRNPEVDPLFEKFVNKKSDEEIMYAMYPARRALIRYGRRTYTEQVEFAEKMARLNVDPRFDNLDEEIEDIDDEDAYQPPQAKFPTTGEEDAMRFPEEGEEDIEEE